MIFYCSAAARASSFAIWLIRVDLRVTFTLSSLLRVLPVFCLLIKRSICCSILLVSSPRVICICHWWRVCFHEFHSANFSCRHLLICMLHLTDNCKLKAKESQLPEAIVREVIRQLMLTKEDAEKTVAPSKNWPHIMSFSFCSTHSTSSYQLD